MDKLSDWLTLQHTKGIGAQTIHQLLTAFESVSHINRATASALQAAGLSEHRIRALRSQPNQEGIHTDLQWAEAENHHIISYDDHRYPVQLRNIASPPPILYAIGDLDLLSTFQLAIVGSRNPTQSGAETAAQFSKHLGAAGITITSGLALGIDAAAHQGALAADALTIAVTGTGLDRVYPARNRELAHHIAEQGVLVSEYPIGTPPKPALFPRRNRIISGLTMGTLIVEAAIKSGSLSTARHAMEQGREVFAIPGSIHNPLARGCHHLIRQGAKLVETADDILEELSAQIAPFTALNTPSDMEVADEERALPDELDTEYSALYACIDYTPKSIDKLVELSQLNAGSVASMLLVLELQGRVQLVSGGRYTRATPPLSTTS